MLRLIFIVLVNLVLCPLHAILLHTRHRNAIIANYASTWVLIRSYFSTGAVPVVVSNTVVKNLTGTNIAALVIVAGRQCICTGDAFGNMSSEWQEAILAHEEGHFFHGHLNNHTSGLLLETEVEFEADTYAAERGHAGALVEVLRHFGEIYGMYEMLQQRIDRLEEMI